MSVSTRAGLAVALLVVSGVVGAWAVLVADSDPRVQVGDLAGLMVMIVLPLAVAAGLLAWRVIGQGLFGVLSVATPVTLLVVAFGAAFIGASFRSGLEYGFFALLATFVAITAVAMPEGAHWAQTGGAFILEVTHPRCR
jgi:hypothetical protein